MDLHNLLDSRRYDPAKSVRPEQVILRIDSQTIGSIQNIVTVSGLPKQGKSRYIGAMAASAISRQEIFNIRMKLPEEKPVIGYFDTEQGEYDYYKSMNYISHLAGGFTENFHSFNTREDFPKIQINLIKTFLEEQPNCSVLFLDGILDLLDSYNDEKESIRLMRLLKKWSKEKDLLIILVLHRKKDGSSTLGHIGSAIDRVSQSILTVEKSKERSTYILKPEFLRSAEDFTPVEIFYNKQAGQWQQTFFTPDEGEKVIKLRKLKPEEIIIDTHRDNVRRIFSVNNPLSYADLIQLIKEFYQVGKTAAEQTVKFLHENQLIFRTQDGYTNDRRQVLFKEK